MCKRWINKCNSTLVYHWLDPLLSLQILQNVETVTRWYPMYIFCLWYSCLSLQIQPILLLKMAFVKSIVLQQNSQHQVSSSSLLVDRIIFFPSNALATNFPHFEYFPDRHSFRSCRLNGKWEWKPHPQTNRLHSKTNSHRILWALCDKTLQNDNSCTLHYLHFPVAYVLFLEMEWNWSEKLWFRAQVGHWND